MNEMENITIESHELALDQIFALLDQQDLNITVIIE